MMVTLLAVVVAIHVSDALSVPYDFYVSAMRCRFAATVVVANVVVGLVSSIVPSKQSS
jgi:hypothetical protein